MLHVELPPPLDSLVCTLTSFLDDRHAELLEPLFLGTLSRTAAVPPPPGSAPPASATPSAAPTLCWAPSAAARSTPSPPCCGTVSTAPHQPSRTLAVGHRRHADAALRPVRGAGAGLHHNPTPGPAGSPFLYGHNWVTLAWVARHPDWHTLALPLRTELYIRHADLPKIDADRRPDFHTKLDQAAAGITLGRRGVARQRPAPVVPSSTASTPSVP